MTPLHKVQPAPDMDALMASLRTTIESGWVGEGPRVAQFETAMGAVTGSAHVTATNSCTSALTLALRLAGVGPGDEVITTPMTCMATNLPILLAGAVPVWADVDTLTGNILPASIQSRLTPRTKAIMIVHWGGRPCALHSINAIAQSAGIKVIEDAAHALGASYDGRPIGVHSDLVCFSFQAIKHIHTGDGGLLTCRGMVDHARARSLKWFGIDRERRQVNDLGIAEWDIVEPGYKFHMNDIAATIGLALLPTLPANVEHRRHNAAAYDAAFSELRRVWLPPTSAESACWLYTMHVDDQRAFIRYMAGHGVACSIVHARNDHAKVFAQFRRDDLPGVEQFAASMVCIPVGPWVGDAERARVIEAVTAEGW